MKDTEESAGPEIELAQPIFTDRVIGKTKPPTHIVDPYERGDYVTIGAAITAASPGDRILVRPGLYRETLTIEKPLEILGDGPIADIEIHGQDETVVWFLANIGRIANLTLRQTSSGNGPHSCVMIGQGRLELEGCDITSIGTSSPRSGVTVFEGADPRVRRNTIHDCTAGILIFGQGRGLLEDNEITNNNTGIHIIDGAMPTLRRNIIHNNQITGVAVYRNGLGILEGNDISINANGVEIMQGGRPTLRGNRINRNRKAAVWIHDAGQGVFENNDLRNNTGGAWSIDTASEVSVIRVANDEDDE
jgi:F-box protein 11